MTSDDDFIPVKFHAEIDTVPPSVGNFALGGIGSPLCTHINPQKTRVAIGHAEGFLVFRVCVETDITHLQIDPFYNTNYRSFKEFPKNWEDAARATEDRILPADTCVGFLGGGVRLIEVYNEQPFVALVGGGATPLRTTPKPPDDTADVVNRKVVLLFAGKAKNTIQMSEPIESLQLGNSLYVTTQTHVSVYKNPFEAQSCFLSFQIPLDPCVRPICLVQENRCLQGGVAEASQFDFEDYLFTVSDENNTDLVLHTSALDGFTLSQISYSTSEVNRGKNRTNTLAKVKKTHVGGIQELVWHMSSAARESGNQTFAPVLVASVGMEEPNFLVLWELRKLRDPTRTGGTDHTWEQKYIFQPLFSLRLDTPGVFRGVSQKRQFLFLQDGRYLFCNVNDTIQVFSTEKANHGTSTWERVSDFFHQNPTELGSIPPLIPLRSAAGVPSLPS
ncbi:hypothetical protein AGDE_12625 [Angomonas deanei]|nr:hypothetical protein AGDE_12625 [Angomonas deanei]|eukprot:EPY23933.1 hypothetical protein AGDE_12625 [Angomonas deanei]